MLTGCGDSSAPPPSSDVTPPSDVSQSVPGASSAPQSEEQAEGISMPDVTKICTLSATAADKLAIETWLDGCTVGALDTRGVYYVVTSDNTFQLAYDASMFATKSANESAVAAKEMVQSINALSLSQKACQGIYSALKDANLGISDSTLLLLIFSEYAGDLSGDESGAATSSSSDISDTVTDLDTLRSNNTVSLSGFGKVSTPGWELTFKSDYVFIKNCDTSFADSGKFVVIGYEAKCLMEKSAFTSVSGLGAIVLSPSGADLSSDASVLGLLAQTDKVRWCIYQDDLKSDNTALGLIACPFEGYGTYTITLPVNHTSDLTSGGKDFGYWAIKVEIPVSETTSSVGSTETSAPIKETLSQQNAVKQAKSYIKYGSYSYSGLIEMLEYKKYSHADAVYGADHCDADWAEECYEQAQSYLKYGSYSREGLIEMLEYKQYTASQIEYAIRKVGY